MIKPDKSAEDIIRRLEQRPETPYIGQRDSVIANSSAHEPGDRAPRLAPSREEQEAISRLSVGWVPIEKRYSPEAVAARVAEIEADAREVKILRSTEKLETEPMKSKTEPTLLEADKSRIEDEIDELLRKLERGERIGPDGLLRLEAAKLRKIEIQAAIDGREATMIRAEIATLVKQNAEASKPRRERAHRSVKA